MSRQSLLEEIGRGPSLSGAACAGMAPLFDARGEGEPRARYLNRVRKAASICETCPVLANCREAVLSSKPSRRTGIWAGLRFGKGS